MLRRGFAGVLALVAAMATMSSAHAGFVATYDDGTSATDFKRVNAMTELTDSSSGDRFWLVAAESGDADVLMRIEEDGSIGWQQRLYISVREIEPTANTGEAIVIGKTANHPTEPFKPFAFTVADDGTIGWANVYKNATSMPGDTFDVFEDVVVESSSYVITGRKYTETGTGFQADFWALSLDTSGAVNWQYSYGFDGYDNFGPANEEAARSIVKTSSGYLLFGQANSDAITGGTQYGMLLLDISNTGTLNSEWVYNAIGSQFGARLIQKGSGYLLLGPATSGPGAPGNDYLMIDIASDLSISSAQYVDFGGYDGPGDVQLSGTDVAIVGVRSDNPSPFDGTASSRFSLFNSAGVHQSGWTFDLAGGDMFDRLNVNAAGDFFLAGTADRGMDYATGTLAFALVDSSASPGVSCSPISAQAPVQTTTAANVSRFATTIAANSGVATSSVSPSALTLTDLGSSYARSVACGPPSLTVTPPSLVFSDTEVGMMSSSLAVTLESTGGSSLSVDTLALADTTHFTVAPGTCGAAPFTLAVGETCQVDVTFAPTAEGALGTTLDIASNDGASSTTSVALSGTGEPPNVVPPDPPGAPERTLELGSPSLVFSGDGMTLPLTLTSTGTDPLLVGALLLPEGAPYTVGLGDCGALPISLAPMASCTLDVTFTPAADAETSVLLDVSSNDTARPLRSVKLYQQGALAFDNPSYAFDAQGPKTIDDGPVARFELVNNGVGPVRLDAVNLPDSAEFSFASDAGCLRELDEAAGAGILVPEGGRCIFSVVFTPGAPGDFATQITVDAAVDVPPLDISGVMTALPDGCAVAPERSLADGWWLGVLALGLWRRRRQG